MSYLIVLPSIHQPYTDECVAGMADELQEHLVIVDNTGERNLGVAASWNIGARTVLEKELDWLIVCSAATRFGSSGGRDFVERLETLPNAWVVETGIDIDDRLPVVGWHFLAWSRVNVLERVGRFDENFWPAYGEDMDTSFRVLQAMKENDHDPNCWPKITTDAWLAMAGHGCALAGITIPYPKLWSYYESKWGGPFGKEPYVRPFNDPSLGLDFWPVPPDSRSII